MCTKNELEPGICFCVSSHRANEIKISSESTTVWKHSLFLYFHVQLLEESWNIALCWLWASLCEIVAIVLRPIWLRSQHSGSSWPRCSRPANPAKAIKALAAWLPSAAAAVTSCHASCLRLTPIWPFYNPYWLGSQYIPFIFQSFVWSIDMDRSVSPHMTSDHMTAEKCFPSHPDPGTSCSRSEPELFVTFWLRPRLWSEGPGWVTDYYYALSASHDLCG